MCVCVCVICVCVCVCVGVHVRVCVFALCVANLGFRVHLCNKIGHPAGCVKRGLIQVPVFGATQYRPKKA